MGDGTRSWDAPSAPVVVMTVFPAHARQLAIAGLSQRGIAKVEGRHPAAISWRVRNLQELCRVRLLWLRKPDPAIFELALERMGGVTAQESLFLDDHPANVAAAEALGMQGILVGEDLARVIAEIDRHLHTS